MLGLESMHRHNLDDVDNKMYALFNTSSGFGFWIKSELNWTFVFRQRQVHRVYQHLSHIYIFAIFNVLLVPEVSHGPYTPFLYGQVGLTSSRIHLSNLSQFKSSLMPTAFFFLRPKIMQTYPNGSLRCVWYCKWSLVGISSCCPSWIGSMNESHW